MGSSIGKIFGTGGLLGLAGGGLLETAAAGVGIKKLWKKDKKKSSGSSSTAPTTTDSTPTDTTPTQSEDIQGLNVQDETEEKLKKRKLLGGY